jgi:hypothetical protein
MNEKKSHDHKVENKKSSGTVPGNEIDVGKRRQTVKDSQNKT